MKFQTTRTEFLDTLLFSSRAIGSRVSQLVLNGIMLDVGEELTAYSTDLEMSIKGTMEVKVIEKGKAVVPARILVNILKSLKESKIELELDKTTNQVKIVCGNAIFTLNTLSLEEYPEFPEIKKDNYIKLSLKNFKNIVTKAKEAASLDEGRAILTGVLVEAKEGFLSMVATDSYRLSLAKENIDKSIPLIKVVVPAKVLDSIIKSEYKESYVEIYIEEKQVSFYIGGGKNKKIIVSRILSGKFPEYKQLIPRSLKHNIVVDKEKILDVVKRISSISRDNIPVKLTIDEGKITVSMDIREIGSSSEDFEISYEGERIEIAFNPEFLIEGINIMDDKNIILSIEEPLKPILIKPEKNENLIYLLMPIRIS